jgi:hypothetical protein
MLESAVEWVGAVAYVRPAVEASAQNVDAVLLVTFAYYYRGGRLAGVTVDCAYHGCIEGLAVLMC